jgi:hypothetical protein
MQKNQYLQNGVFASPTIPVYGKKVTLTYTGLLPRSGAKEVFARVGFGNHWNDVYDYKMERTPDGFETTIPVSVADNLNICFKDALNNWDNNSGQNYTFKVTD